MSMPSVFLSHGSPMLYLEKDVPARSFLATLGEFGYVDGRKYPRPWV